MSRAHSSLSSVRALARKRRWTEEDARRIVAFGEGRDVPWSAFAEELGVGVMRLHRWRRRFGEVAGGDRPVAAEFLPLVPVGRESSDGAIEVVLESGRRLSIGAAAPSDLAVAILRALMC